MGDEKISTQELIKRMKATRMRPHKTELIDKFNRIIEIDEKNESERRNKNISKKIARSPEIDV